MSELQTGKAGSANEVALRVEADRQSGTLTITLDRPQNGNKLRRDDLVAMVAALHEHRSDAAIKLVVLRAQGAAFCLGRDPSGDPKTTNAVDLRAEVTQPILDVYAAIAEMPVPVIAVVAGDVRGFGCALVGACDITIASASAKFALPEIEANIPPTLAICALMKKISPKQLEYLVYTGASLTAAEALTAGFVSVVVAPGELEATARDVAARLTSKPRAVLSAVKEYFSAAPELTAATAANYASSLISVVLSSKPA